MYRATPLSYYISGLIGTGLSGMNITCAAKDLLQIPSIPDNSTCATYLSSYLKSSGGRLLNGDATSSCQFCPYSKADSVLATFGIYFDERWQNWGITVVFNVINVGLAFLIYWLVCRKKSGVKIGTGVVA
jgi:ATP-binding cassette subfamily G (WHITE) protein 2 (PDR)